jgi:chloride channel 7
VLKDETVPFGLRFRSQSYLSVFSSLKLPLLCTPTTNNAQSLVAGEIMGENVIFVRPVEKVGVIYDILKSCQHSNFPVVDIKDGGVLFGTISRSALAVLLKQREFGHPINKNDSDGSNGDSLRNSIHSDYLEIEPEHEKYVPIVPWEQIEKSYPKYPSHGEIRLGHDDRECFVDLRPYANTAPITVHEFSSVSVSQDNDSK